MAVENVNLGGNHSCVLNISQEHLTSTSRLDFRRSLASGLPNSG